MTRLASLLALGCLSGFGQYAETRIPAQPRFPPITRAPYSGEIVSETVQTLADGTHIRRTMTSTKVYRDSLGRTREERSPFQGPADQAPNATERPTLIEILDPVGQVKYTLDVRGKVAHRQMLLAPGGAPILGLVPSPGGLAEPITDSIVPHTVREKLENQIIEGVLAQGTRITTTLPEGSIGNDRPIIVQEYWRSVELKVPVLNTSTDPRSGERTEKLINISRSEPDQSLFQPPPDYTIVDEKGSFTIKWGADQQ
jgi:hypothetical protein